MSVGAVNRDLFWKRAALTLVLLLFASVGLSVWLGWKLTRSPIALDEEDAGAAEELPDRLAISPVTFETLPGWRDDDLSAALPALRRTCAAWAGRPDERSLGEEGIAGTLADWRPLCAALERFDESSEAFRGLLERELTPVAVRNRDEPEGLFTGYYEPTLSGSRRRSDRFSVPLYRRPPELVNVDLGRFREELKGRRIAGRIEGNALEPFADRARIDSGSLSGRALELLWVDDPIDAFFLQIQGSGRVELAEGGSIRLGYAGQNGHPYRAIGRDLVERGHMTIEEVSMQSIRRWLDENPSGADELMAQNASYVFFRELEEEGPIGSLGVVLTPGRSLAVDAAFIPLGLPVWVDTTRPATAPGEAEMPLRRLLAAQDTGGAIRGPVRGDIFFGPGREAAQIAGRMRQPGRIWLLLPKAVAGRLGE